MTNQLQDRVALITGATRGIGFAAAKALQESGARVAVLARDEETLTAAAATLPAPGADRVLVLAADVTDTQSVHSAVEKAHSWGGQLDIIVNSAGPRLTPSALSETSTDVLAGYLDAKLLGYHRVASAALPLLSDNGSGRIINIAGVTARTLIPHAGVTAITNAAVLALTNYLATETASRNVLVNAISPGMTLTEGWLEKHETIGKEQNKTATEVRDGMTASLGIRTGRWAEPSEIASAVVFLASDQASYLTGSVLDVDGGISKAVI
ncbi:SDR family NAD(P)-dependent oxidoreductase [Mycobacterium sp. AZCC_0083]|uniref:SDR family NAD(P)-dependent oxidoreductase n=1 Tax=Mycobacterium sp. AZCC_0083 TaxID=2735882 RepID=UPI00161FBF6A|nr:SDR family oxidoreductase [Mycobacterium sp. AZCC_0083]MBB5166316.1 3-oxoacyl-[acyl-carrier protein] reductase [Mycobacterium sp. AZCC_0083]